MNVVDLRAELETERYFIILMAYDYKKLRSKKTKTPLDDIFQRTLARHKLRRCLTCPRTSGQFLVGHKQNLPRAFNAFCKGHGGPEVGDNPVLFYTLAF